MSYQVLARKYRPKSFDTLVGQEHVVRALTHALENKRLHHAYLFTGTRGVGKTTLSRILAKAFNCQGPDGNGDITAQPCGVCDACTSIDAGRFVDYIEMDAASNRGVDEMGQLLEQAVYAPSNARFKVYMIDEVHMLTNHAFNSMLKTLEEPPEHVKFILATTDPQKIPMTVLSRCLQFNLKQMPPGHIVSHLDNILSQEGIGFDTTALRLLARGAHGSMRDALSLTDQAIAYAAGKVTLEAVQGMLGALDQSFLIRVLDALAAKDGAGLLAVADEMAVRSLSYNAALQDLGSLLHRIALAQSAPAALPDDLPEREDIVRLAALFDAEEVQLFYQIAVHGRNELGLAPDEFAGFSMTLLRMLAFRPGMGGADSSSVSPDASTPAPRATGAAQVQGAARLAAAPQAMMSTAQISAPAPVARNAGGMSPARAALEAARGSAKPLHGNAMPGSRAVGPAVGPAMIPVTSPIANASASNSAGGSEAVLVAAAWDEELPSADSRLRAVHNKIQPVPAARPIVSERVGGRPGVSADPVPIQVESAPAIPVPARSGPYQPIPVAALNWDGDWPALATVLAVRGVVQQLAQQSELINCEKPDGSGPAKFQLRIASDALVSVSSVERLGEALSSHFGQEVRVTTELGAVLNTASAIAQAERAERQRDAEQTMQSDPFVQTLMREFGASIVPGSIKPAA
ncbi:hypothetical protein BH11PSE11_BH11PSE11_12030 [soil metagenome]